MEEDQETRRADPLREYAVVRRAAAAIGLIFAAILIAALCYAAGFIEGYELGQRVALLPGLYGMATIGN